MTTQFKFNQWNCWVGVYYGTFGDPLTGPFYVGGEPLKATRIKRPVDAMMYVDSATHWFYSPLVWPFDKDVNLDGMMDSDDAIYTGDLAFSFNAGRPTVHNNGCNVTLLDAHAEWVSFKKLWQVDRANKVVHSFWYLED